MDGDKHKLEINRKLRERYRTDAEYRNKIKAQEKAYRVRRKNRQREFTKFITEVSDKEFIQLCNEFWHHNESDQPDQKLSDI